MNMSHPSSTWFREATYGLFIHWGPYAIHGRGEQVLMRELLDQHTYAATARNWCPDSFDAAAWAAAAVRGGFRYAVLTARHHDGFCLWKTATTDYSSAATAAGRDFVGEFVGAFRAAGLRVGLYLSWNDFHDPDQFAGTAEAWARLRARVHAQVEELCTRYGRIDIFWFDGAWPGSAIDWDSAALVSRMRRWQPAMLINNRLGEQPGQPPVNFMQATNQGNETGLHESGDCGDFGTPEHHITAQSGRLWESCQVTTWRLWGYAAGERWRDADICLDMLTEAACKGGNLLLNVGPEASGVLPHAFLQRSAAIGDWLRVHGEAVYGVDPVQAGESVLFGHQCRRGNTLYLICRFWHGHGWLRFQGLATPVRQATLLSTGEILEVRSDDRAVEFHGLPRQSPIPLFPVIKVELDGPPRTHPTFQPGMWGGDPRRLAAWGGTTAAPIWSGLGRTGFPPHGFKT